MGIFLDGSVVEDSVHVGYDAMSLDDRSLICRREVKPLSSRISRREKTHDDEGSMFLQNAEN
jgi:hypothetical protein